MRLNHRQLETIREEFTRALVEQMSQRDLESFAYNALYLQSAMDDAITLERKVTRAFSEDFWIELKESVIAEDMI